MSKDFLIDDPSKLSLRQRLRFLAKDSILYGGAAAFNKALALITFPLLARHFSVEQYGLIDFFNVLTSLLATLLIFGQDSAVARFFYETKETPERKQIISQSLVFQMGLSLAFLPLLWPLTKEVAGWISKSGDSETLLKLVLLQVPFFILINYSQNILKWTFARSRFLFISIGSTVLSVIALLVGIVGFDLGMVEVFVIYLSSRALFGFLGLWLIRHWLTRPTDWRFFGGLLRYAAPLGVICTIGMFMPTLERTFVMEFIGARELGLYVAGAKVAMLIALPIQAFQVAWGPFSLSLFKEANAPQTYNWVLKSFAVGILSLGLILTLVAEPVLQLLTTNRYSGASVVVFAMSAGLAVEAISWITGIGIGFSKKSYLSLYSYGAFLVVSAAATYCLLHLFGMPGVAWGVLLGHLAKAITETWLAQRAHPLPWEFSGVASLTALTIGVGVVNQLLISTGDRTAGSLVVALGLLVVIYFGWMVVFTREERARMTSRFR